MSGRFCPRTVPVVGRTAGKLTIAAGLFGLGAVLRAVSMLIETTPITAWDWVSLALTAAAAAGLGVNAVKARRERTSRHGEPQER